LINLSRQPGSTRVLRKVLLKKLKTDQTGNHILIEEALVGSCEDRLIAQETDSEIAKRLNHAIDRLTTRQKLILRLHYYEGLSYAQIADRLSMNYQSVNNLAFRTIRQLRSVMACLFAGIPIGPDHDKKPGGAARYRLQGARRVIYFSYQADSLRATTVVYGAVSRQRELNPDRLLSNVLTPAGLSIQKVNNVYIIAPAVTFDTVDDQSPGRNSWRRSRRQLVE
jgi:hypothetical protein